MMIEIEQCGKQTFIINGQKFSGHKKNVPLRFQMSPVRNALIAFFISEGSDEKEADKFSVEVLNTPITLGDFFSIGIQFDSKGN